VHWLFRSCTGPIYTFPLYDGSESGNGKLVRCINPLSIANLGNCDSAALGTYNVEIYNNAFGTGNVAGCARSNIGTPCPATAPFPYLAQIDPANPGAPGASPTFAITQCRSGPTSCTTNAKIGSVTYSVPMTTSVGALVRPIINLVSFWQRLEPFDCT
jgi:hypothetical protein